MMKKFRSHLAKKESIEITGDDDVAVVTFLTPSMANEDDIEASFNKLIIFIERKKPAKMVIDFGQVRFFSSRVLGELLKVKSRLESYGGRVVISAINPQLYRVFRVTSLDKIFSFYPDKTAALKELKEN
jgi:anti-sigma B factor antagonist